MIAEIIIDMTKDIVDTALLYIPQEKKGEFLLNIIQISLVHRKEVELYMNKKGAQKNASTL